MKQLTQAHTAGKGWKCKITWCIWGIRASNLRPAPKEDDVMESGADHRGAEIWEMSAQTCCSTRRLGVGLGEGRQVKENLRLTRQETGRPKRRYYNLTFPPWRVAHPRMCSFLCLFCVPGFFSAGKMYHHLQDLCQSQVEGQWGGYGLKSSIPWPVSPAITLHILKWSNFSLEFFYFPFPSTEIYRCSGESFLGHATIFLVDLWALRASCPGESTGWVLALTLLESFGSTVKGPDLWPPCSPTEVHHWGTSDSQERQRGTPPICIPRCALECHATFHTQTANTNTPCCEPAWTVWAGRFKWLQVSFQLFAAT